MYCRKNRIFLAQIIHSTSVVWSISFDFWRADQLEENKDRVSFYKFGDFRKHKGSNLARLPNYFSYLFSFFFSKDLGGIFSLITSLVVYTYIQINIFEQRIIWMIHTPHYCLYINLQSLLFEDSRNEIPLPRLLIPFSSTSRAKD